MFQTDDKFLEIRDVEAPYTVRRHCSPGSPPGELETYSCLLWTALFNVVLRVSFSPCESSSQDKFLSFQPASSAAILPLPPSVRFGLRSSSGRIHVAQQQDRAGVRRRSGNPADGGGQVAKPRALASGGFAGQDGEHNPFRAFRRSQTTSTWEKPAPPRHLL